jgi:hypothetical protein
MNHEIRSVSMNKIRIILVICLVAIISTNTAQAQFLGMVIYPAKLEPGAIVMVDAGQPISVEVSWSACHKALVDIASRVSHLELWLDGNQLGESAIAGAVPAYSSQAYQPDKETFRCMGKVDVVWGIAVISFMGTLPPGDHILRAVWEFDHPVQSGADQNGDGRPDLFRGRWLDNTITIRVLAPAG